MTRLLSAALARSRAHGTDRGETPMAIILGLAVFALLVLSAGPTLLALTSQSSATSNDRRADKALAVLADSARREPWAALPLGGPTLDTVDLAGHSTKVATWIQTDTSGTNRRLITKAIAPYGTNTDCASATTPASLPRGCVTRTAVVTATATDVRPATSPSVTVKIPGTAQAAGATVTTGQNIFDVAVTQPTLVTVVTRTSSDVTLHLVSTNVVRATMSLKSSAANSDWRFGNAVLCPSWSKGSASTARLQTPTSAALSDLLVLTTPAPAGSCR